jgi:trans-aconitate methyltransferase
MLARRAFNIARGLVQLYGTATLKRRLWDWEFRRGHWRCLDDTPDDPAYPYLTQYANHGRILDLGCGPGSAGRHLDPALYQTYVGVDVSNVAIEQARRTNNRSQNTYVQADFFEYRPDNPCDVILLGDSLYYIPLRETLGMLRKYHEYLTSSGVFIVKMHTTPAFQPFFQMIRNHFRIVAQHVHDPVTIVIFRMTVLAAGCGAVD